MKYFVTIILIAIAALVVASQLWANHQKGHTMGKHATYKVEPGKIEVYNVSKGQYEEVDTVIKTKEEWKALLTDFEYHVAFEQGTERAFTGELNDNKRKGVYRAKACGVDLFHSDHKFDSGTGWPSFYKPVDEKNIRLVQKGRLFSWFKKSDPLSNIKSNQNYIRQKSMYLIL